MGLSFLSIFFIFFYLSVCLFVCFFHIFFFFFHLFKKNICYFIVCSFGRFDDCGLRLWFVGLYYKVCGYGYGLVVVIHVVAFACWIHVCLKRRYVACFVLPTVLHVIL